MSINSEFMAIMPVNILFASWYVGLGGGETDLVTLADSLDPERYTPHLLLPREGQLSEHWNKRGWPVHFVSYRGATTLFVPALWARLPAVSRMAHILQAHDIHLVHSDYHTLPFIVPAAKRVNIPVMWTVIGWWFAVKRWQYDFFSNIPTIARSYHIRERHLGNPPFMPPEDIPVIYSGVDIERFNPDVDNIRVRFETNIPQNAPVVAMIARFQRVKGHHIFQQMAQQVALQVPSVHFVVAGEEVFGVGKDQAYKQEILERAESDPLLRNRLHYIGFRQDVERVIGAADVVVVPSDFESYGKVNLEAMACATPVVSTNNGGPRETIIHEKTGFLVEPGDAEGLARYVIQLLQDATQRTQMGRAARRHVVQTFSAEQFTAQYVQQFEQMLATQATP